MPRKRKTTKLQYADGKSEEQEKQSVEDILGIQQKNHFQATSDAEFDAKLKEMTVQEMQEMAVNAGVFPSGTKPMLRNKLKKAFAEYMLTSGKIVAQKTKSPHPESSLQQKVMTIMNTWDR